MGRTFKSGLAIKCVLLYDNKPTYHGAVVKIPGRCSTTHATTRFGLTAITSDRGAVIVDAIVLAMGIPPDTKTSIEFGLIEPQREDPSGDAPISMVDLRAICMEINERRESNPIDLRGLMGHYREEVASEILYQVVRVGSNRNTFALLHMVQISAIWQDGVDREWARTRGDEFRTNCNQAHTVVLKPD